MISAGPVDISCVMPTSSTSSPTIETHAACAIRFKLTLDFFDRDPKRRIAGDPPQDQVVRMNHRRMIAAEMFADRRERSCRSACGTGTSRPGGRTRCAGCASSTSDRRAGYGKNPRPSSGSIRCRASRRALRIRVLQRLPREIHGDRRVVERRQRRQPRQASFELANVRRDTLRDIHRDLGRQPQIFERPPSSARSPRASRDRAARYPRSIPISKRLRSRSSRPGISRGTLSEVRTI